MTSLDFYIQKQNENLDRTYIHHLQQQSKNKLKSVTRKAEQTSPIT